MTPRRLPRWAVMGWIVLVVAGAGLTFYLHDRSNATQGRPHWERVPSPASEPVPCPEGSGAGMAPTARDCTYWQRG
ncbi:hypothetical protein ACIPJK_34620 [Streptomyces roseus]|uniref:hypothetical protein n=1 Tax=Streptomyces roseus TaxID=66430 RepID=UPI00380A1E36